MTIAPPAKQSAGPNGLTTIPFWLGLYRPRMIGFSLTLFSERGRRLLVCFIITH